MNHILGAPDLVPTINASIKKLNHPPSSFLFALFWCHLADLLLQKMFRFFYIWRTRTVSTLLKCCGSRSRQLSIIFPDPNLNFYPDSTIPVPVLCSVVAPDPKLGHWIRYNDFGSTTLLQCNEICFMTMNNKLPVIVFFLFFAGTL